MSGPLDGVKVLEFSQIIAAPFGGQILADLGADVLKVEPPAGESWRLQALFAPTESKTYQCLNRGKRCITLSLDDPAATEIVNRLVEDMDVVLINYRPDVPKKFHVDYESLSAIKPDLVYVDLTAFGRRGPWAMRPGYDGVVQAVTGLMAGEGKRREDGTPQTISSTAIADYSTGMVLADAVVTALYHRECTGEGQLVECSLFATALNIQADEVMEHALADRAVRNPLREKRRQRRREGATFAELAEIRESGLHHPDAFYRAYLTKDGALVVAARSDGERAKAIEILGAADPKGLSARFALHTNDEWMARLNAGDVPASPVNFAEEMERDEQVLANDLVTRFEHDVTGPQSQVGSLLKFSESPLDPIRASPPLGRDTEDVLRSIGYTDADIDALKAGGVIRGD
ncbi:MAG: CoA transferase [Gammaproteobacteria bacterium]|nr:CoA transferase [Gammaproteobacteria bacterium]